MRTLSTANKSSTIENQQVGGNPTVTSLALFGSSVSLLGRQKTGKERWTPTFPENFWQRRLTVGLDIPTHAAPRGSAWLTGKWVGGSRFDVDHLAPITGVSNGGEPLGRPEGTHFIISKRLNFNRNSPSILTDRSPKTKNPPSFCHQQAARARGTNKGQTAIINIFQSVQRRHQSTGQGLMWRNQCGFVVDRTVQIAAHEIIRTLEVVSVRKCQNTLLDRTVGTNLLSWVHFISDFELNDRRWIHRFSVYHNPSALLLLF